MQVSNGNAEDRGDRVCRTELQNTSKEMRHAAPEQLCHCLNHPLDSRSVNKSWEEGETKKSKPTVFYGRRVSDEGDTGRKNECK